MPRLIKLKSIVDYAKSKIGYTVQTVVVAVVSIVATLYFTLTKIDGTITTRIDEKVAAALKEFETERNAIKRENEITKACFECYFQMQAGRCNKNYTASLQAYNIFLQKYRKSEIPETFALYLVQERLNAIVSRGDFHVIFLDEIENLEKSIAQSPTSACISSYVNLGICFLSLKKTDVSRKHLFHALDMTDKELSGTCQGNDCYDPVDEISYIILLSALVETGSNQVESATHFLELCRRKRQINLYTISDMLRTQRDKGICKYLMESYNGTLSKAYDRLIKSNVFPKPPEIMPAKEIIPVPPPPAKTGAKARRLPAWWDEQLPFVFVEEIVGDFLQFVQFCQLHPDVVLEPVNWHKRELLW